MNGNKTNLYLLHPKARVGTNIINANGEATLYSVCVWPYHQSQKGNFKSGLCVLEGHMSLTIIVFFKILFFFFETYCIFILQNKQ